MPAPSPKPFAYRDSTHFGAPWLGYALALAVTLICGGISMAFFPGVAKSAPFLFFYPGIAIASFVGGSGPGLGVIVGAALFGLFINPVYPAPGSWVALAGLGSVLTYSFARLRNLRNRTAMVAEESARLRFVMERVSDWIFLVDDNGKIQYVNQTACEQLNYSADQLIGMSIDELEGEPGNAAISGLAARSRDGAVPPAEIIFHRPNGSPVTAEVSCTAIRTGDSGVVHVAARNITERKQLDQKLREAIQWESLGALTGGVAHDFNNLLTAIMGNASLAREMISPKDPAAPLLGAVEKAGERCAELIRLMLAASGYRPRTIGTLRVDEMAHEAVKALPPGVRIDVQAETCEFVSDRATIDTLLRGLIANAVESYGDGPGEVSVRVRLGPVPRLGEASFAEGEPGTGTYLGIIVEDRGCGMPGEVVERAFNPFFTTKFTGRGLGLSAVRGIVRAHAGILWMKTQPGAGTRVEVWLPAAGYHQSAQISAHV
jgi:two-component system cell cycle sensor histidine kinase/response regulator CckA